MTTLEIILCSTLTTLAGMAVGIAFSRTERIHSDPAMRRLREKNKALAGALIRAREDAAVWKRIAAKDRKEVRELNALVETLKDQLAPTGD